MEYESVIAEIVDNSMDNNAENVLIRFSGKRWDDFSAVILDDGVGFTPEKLFNSFDLAIQDVAKNSVGEEKRTGINDIGMKRRLCHFVTQLLSLRDLMMAQLAQGH